MSATQRVIRAQRLLGAAAITQSLAWGAACALAILAAISFAALAKPGFDKHTGTNIFVALISGAAVAASFLWRSRHFTSANRVALWIEERIPELHYSLVTALEHAGSPFTGGMEAEIERHDVGGVTLAALRRRLGPAIGALAVAGLLLYVSPSTAFGRAGILGRLTGAGRSGNAPFGNKLEDVEARVTPPAYTGQRPLTIADPTTIAALIGSRVVIHGRGGAETVSGAIPGATVSAVDAENGWSISFTMPTKPSALTLKDRSYDRIIVLDPRADSPPKIALTSPTRDTTLRVAQLVIQLNATATDDIGLKGAYFEYLITTGSGELFNARTVTTPVVSFGGERSGQIRATLDLASLKLNQGDVVSIRAIAQDGNSLTGPGLATSDTRTFRIARADEYDSVAVDAAAPLPVDTAAMSQRMLIAMTEKLVKEQK